MYPFLSILCNLITSLSPHPRFKTCIIYKLFNFEQRYPDLLTVFFQAQKECPNYIAADMSSKHGAMLLLHLSKNPIRLKNCHANDFVITQISCVRNSLDHKLPCSHHHRFALYREV